MVAWAESAKPSSVRPRRRRPVRGRAVLDELVLDGLQLFRELVRGCSVACPAPSFPQGLCDVDGVAPCWPCCDSAPGSRMRGQVHLSQPTVAHQRVHLRRRQDLRGPAVPAPPGCLLHRRACAWRTSASACAETPSRPKPPSERSPSRIFQQPCRLSRPPRAFRNRAPRPPSLPPSRTSSGPGLGRIGTDRLTAAARGAPSGTCFPCPPAPAQSIRRGRRRRRRDPRARRSAGPRRRGSRGSPGPGGRAGRRPGHRAAARRPRADRLGDRAGLLRAADLGRRIAVEVVLADQEPIERPERNEHASHRGGREGLDGGRRPSRRLAEKVGDIVPSAFAGSSSELAGSSRARCSRSRR